MKKLIWSNSYETAEEIREYVLANSEEFEEDGLSGKTKKTTCPCSLITIS